MITAAQLEGFRKRINDELAEVGHALVDVEAGRGVVKLDQSSVGRLSRMDAMQQQAMASGVKDRLLRQKWRLKAALNRIDTNQFGVCCQCGEEIPLERLEADFATPFCAYCQEEIDERRKTG
jgi:DnaK suppressor protein